MEIGADYIATGHYARVIQLPSGRWAVQKSVTEEKDQTYALYNLTQEQLSRTLMPDGAYTKAEIRAIAEKAGLPVAHKPDSQEICFVPDNDYAGFIARDRGIVPECGNFVDKDGNILGRHRGIIHYTVGQRRGLELPMGERVYVVGKDIKEGAYVLSLDAEPEVPVQYMIQNTEPDSVLDSGNVTVREAVTIHLEERQVLKITGTARISLPKKAWWMP